ncbi:MAG: electron transfer flavoprotein subunit beta/FixA family protein [Bacteroidota bacterium]
MKIAVCINHVPDTETKVKIAPDNASLDRSGVNFMLSPYDEFGIEEALRLRDKFKGEVIALSLGGDANKDTLRKALAMGVDRAILLKDDAVRDSYSVAAALAEELRPFAPDLIFFGKQSIDYDNSQVGTLVATLLGIPSASVVVKLEVREDGSAVCEREIEGGHETLQLQLPAAITAQKGLNEPRYPSLKGIMAAKNKPIDVKPAAAAPLRVETIGMKRPTAKGAGKILGTDKSAVPELIRLLHEEAKVI